MQGERGSTRARREQEKKKKKKYNRRIKGREIEVYLLDLSVPKLVVPLVTAVNGFILRGEGHGADVHELAQRVIEGETMDARPEGHDHVDGGAVHAVARGHHLRAGLQDVRGSGLDVVPSGLLENTEDGAGGHVAVDVGGPIQGVEGAAEAATEFGRNYDRVLLFFGYEKGTSTGFLRVAGQRDSGQ